MDDKTTQESYDKMLECFKKTFEETFKIREQNAWTIDQLDPTYVNVKSIHGMVHSLVEEIKQLHTKVDRLERKIDLLNNK